MSGAFFVNRGVFERLDDLFPDEPYSEREAWIWLFGNAAWRSTKVRVKNRMVPLERGQLAFSIRFLAEKWQWKKNHVESFLNLLKKEDMIRTEPGHGISVITICNYNKYQLMPGYNPDTKQAETRTEPGRNPDKEESLNKRIDIVQTPKKRTPEPDPLFLEFYLAYPKRQSKNDAIKAYAQVRKAGVQHETIMRGLEQAKRSDFRFRDRQFTPLPASWLRAGGFEDETAASQSDDWKRAIYS